jgi:sporulation protein YlmC with PRC-barrel domain
MLRSLKTLERYTVSATDGEIGSVANFLLDDQSWVVRYLVVETGTFFERRRVLISPVFFRQTEWSTRRFHLSLTVDKVKNSPSVDLDKPVSRQHERDYYRYYNYPYYLETSGFGGVSSYPVELASSLPHEIVASDDLPGNVHLRSINELAGYHIHGSDGSIGHVQDFIVDDETYAVRYLVVNTRNTWFGKKVLVAPGWASRVSWEERAVYVALSRQAIKNSPMWDPAVPVTRSYEMRLHDYYGRPAYWATADAKPVETEHLHRLEHEVEGGGAGALAGALLGVVAGPPGMVAGALIGGAAGAITGAALDTESVARAMGTRVLDTEIGVGEGDLGAPNLAHPPAKTGAYSAASAGVDTSSGEPCAEGPMPPPER